MTHIEWEQGNAVLEKWGLRLPMADVGGVRECVMADYSEGGTGTLRIPEPTPPPWHHLEKCYAIIGPQYGDRTDLHGKEDAHAPLEEIAYRMPTRFGTVLCTSTMEHARNPLALACAIAHVMRPGGLLYASAPFSWPVHGDPAEDLWRFSEAGLKHLALQAGLCVLETGALQATAGRSISWLAASRGILSAADVLTIVRPELVKS